MISGSTANRWTFHCNGMQPLAGCFRPTRLTSAGDVDDVAIMLIEGHHFSRRYSIFIHFPFQLFFSFFFMIIIVVESLLRLIRPDSFRWLRISFYLSSIYFLFPPPFFCIFYCLFLFFKCHYLLFRVVSPRLKTIRKFTSAGGWKIPREETQTAVIRHWPLVFMRELAIGATDSILPAIPAHSGAFRPECVSHVNRLTSNQF